MFNAINHAKLGNKDEMELALKQLDTFEPRFTSETAHERLVRDSHHGFVSQIVDGLNSAGMRAN